MELFFLICNSSRQSQEINVLKYVIKPFLINRAQKNIDNKQSMPEIFKQSLFHLFCVLFDKYGVNTVNRCK